MTCILNSNNISFLDYRENEICLVLNVVEPMQYCMSPQLALELARSLEAEARKIILSQSEALKKFEARPRP
jgi:hypothetical protein